MRPPELTLIEHDQAGRLKYWRAKFPSAVYRVITMEHGTLVIVETWTRRREIRAPQILAAIRQAIANNKPA